MSDEASDRRAAISESFQRNAPWDPDDGKVIVGWVVVCEWLDGDGKRWLSLNSGNADGEELPNWTRDGYLHEGLYGKWDHEPEEDDDDDD